MKNIIKNIKNQFNLYLDKLDQEDRDDEIRRQEKFKNPPTYYELITEDYPDEAKKNFYKKHGVGLK